MNEELFAGLVITFVTLVGIGYMMLRQNAGIFRMYTAMILIGLGYLTMTGAMNEIGAKILGRAASPPSEAVVPAADKKAEPAPVVEKKAEPTPAAPAKAAEPPAAKPDPDVAPQKDEPPVEDMPPPAPPASGAGAPASP